MPTNVQIKIENLDVLIDMAQKFPRIAEKHIGEAIVRSIAEIQNKAQPITPVKTRRLWGELQIPHFRPFEGWFGSNLDYAGYVHNRWAEGTRFKKPSLNKNAVAGFLSIAVRGSQNLIDDVFKKALELITKDIAK